MPRLETLSLENLCFETICRDVVRHALNYQKKSFYSSDDGPLDYWKFHMIFADRVLEKFQNAQGSMDIEKKYSHRPRIYLAYIKFLFNPHVKRIFLRDEMDFSDDIVEILRANCGQNLYHLNLEKKDLNTASSINFLKSMSNLVHLELYGCFVQRVRTMKIISDFLVHLVSITFEDTRLEDEDLFVLCGHDCPLNNSILKCSYRKNCSAKCKLLKLQEISLLKVNITRTGVACVLTHIPTLTSVNTIPFAGNAIYEIAQHRRQHGIPGIRLLLENIFGYDPKILRTALEVCPVVRELRLVIEEASQSTAIAEVLEQTETKNLSTFAVTCESTDFICNKSFKNFWSKKGPQLRHLKMSVVRTFGSEDYLHLQYILHSCPAVSFLCLRFKAIRTEQAVSLDFPDYRHLRHLSLFLDGDRDFTNTFARDIILKTPTLEKLDMSFSLNSQMLLPVLSENHLKNLREVILCGNDPQETVKIAKFLVCGKRKIAVYFF